MNALDFVGNVVLYCYATRGSVTSWLRTAQHNAAQGGHPQSYHLQGLAADVVYDVPVTPELARLLAKRFDLELVREADHDHLEPLPVPRR